MKKVLIVISFLIFQNLIFLSQTNAQCMNLKVMHYNLLNFPNGSDICGANVAISNREDTLAKILQYVKPDILMVCELQTSAGADLILSDALNIGGVTTYKKANFVLNTDPGLRDLQNMFYYNSAKVELASQKVIVTSLRDINEYKVYVKDPTLGVLMDTTFIYFYECHLKAGSASGDISSRTTDCTTMRNYFNTLPATTNIVMGGDFNFYTNTEGGFQKLCHSGTNLLNDPTGQEGSWTSNITYASILTQSTRSTITTDCGATGGLDDRFDFLLPSTPIMGGTNRVKYIANSYDNIGHDGSGYNRSITDPANTSAEPFDIKRALLYMSDHIPVVLNLEVTCLTIMDFNLLKFSALRDKEKHFTQINWIMSDEQTIANYTVEKSFDGVNWSSIAKIQNSNRLEYKYIDAEPIESIAYYRLMAEELDKTTSYSKIVSVYPEEAPKVTIFPNPTKSSITLQNVPTTANLVQVFNDAGVLMRTIAVPEDHSDRLDISLEALPSGLFFVQIQSGTGVQTHKVTKY